MENNNLKVRISFRVIVLKIGLPEFKLNINQLLVILIRHNQYKEINVRILDRSTNYCTRSISIV